jgi:hypothetical protein
VANFKPSVPSNSGLDMGTAKKGYSSVKSAPCNCAKLPNTRQYPTKQMANTKADMIDASELAGEQDG